MNSKMANTASEKVLSENDINKSVQLLRMRRFNISVATYALAILATFLVTLLGIGDLTITQWSTLIGLCLLGISVFFVLFYTGVNLHFSEPSLTREQIIYSFFYAIVAMHWLPDARPIILLFFLPPFSFGMLSLTLRQYIVVVAGVLVLYAGLLCYEYFQNRQNFIIQYQLFLFVLFSLLLTWFAFFGGFVSNIRQRLQTKKEEIKIKNRKLVDEIENHKKAEDDLQLSHSRFFTVLNSLDATIYVADMDTYEILFANNYMKESFGRDMVGEVCHQAFRNESKPCEHCTNDKLVDSNGHPTGVNVWDGRNPITKKWYMNYDRAIQWTDKKLVKLQIASDITELKDAHKTIEKMSIIDDLTKIYNRRHFHIRLEHEIQRVLRYKHSLSLLFVDIDNFKNINDTYGHQIGDEVLITVASILKFNIRKIDVVARYGGEEFVILLPETDERKACTTGEKIRKLIGNHNFKINDKKEFNITACFGVSSVDHSPVNVSDKSKQVINQADVALYEAKKKGKNLVVLYTNSL